MKSMKSLLITTVIAVTAVFVTTIVAQSPATSAGAAVATQTFLIQGLHCPPCTRTVESSLSRTKGVQSAEVDWSSKNARVAFDEKVISAQQVAQAIAAMPHMMGGGMHYQGSLALKVPGLDDAKGKAAKEALTKVPGVAQVFLYPQQQSLAISFASQGVATTQQLIDALKNAGIAATTFE